MHVMDKTWICWDRLSNEYYDGVNDLLEFAILNFEDKCRLDILIPLIVIWSF